jgi:lon-related putative ATP-dependent protease
MATVMKLSPEALYRRCDPSAFAFETTAELSGGTEIIGQPRAVAAVHFGTGIEGEGYNIFALGPAGTGKKHLVEHFLELEAGKRAVPEDLCYINNFKQPNKPVALHLPAGMAVTFKRDMEGLIEEVASALPAAFEAEEYQARLQAVEEKFRQRPAARLDEVRQQAEARGFVMLRTPVGMMLAPKRGNDVIDPEAFKSLPEEEQRRLRAVLEELQEALQKVLREMPRWDRERRGRIRELNREVSNTAIAHLIDEVRGRYESFPEVLRYLDAVRQDLLDNARELLQSQQAADPFALPSARASSSPLLRRYQVNVLTDHGEDSAAPVVFEDYPTYQNLVGRIEHLAQMGTLVTDFTLIRAGALHRANGGYLILEALKVLQQPFAWEGLKRALKARQIRIESLGQALSLVSTVSLELEPVPLAVKVVLLGDRLLYYLLCAFDAEFAGLFKVAADFDDVIDRDEQNELRYARLIAALAQEKGLRPFDRTAVARAIERSARLVGDAERLSAHLASLADLLCEANYWAGLSGNGVVAAQDVQRAIDAQVYRADRLRARLQEEILRQTINIDTQGTRVGQVNGLSVIQLGSFAFGRPSRITARVRLGKGEVVDIEREVELGGPLHSKGVFILSSFLGARYAAEQPLSFSASLVFEQSYSSVEGDSASSAELYALLSAIAETPIKQSLAVTGSVNQHGEVQAIGGVNEKIEGFFDLCRARGLSGEQGVLIPAANVKHLMLKEEVVRAVAAGEFHVYPIETVDQGMALLMGLPAGERDASGAYPQGSLNALVQERLGELAEKRLAFSSASKSDER